MINRQTTADDVDGWDSLGHSVLIARLSKILGVEIGEDVAASAKTVGMLVDRLLELRQQ
jgi:acyl carrier protein